MVDTTAAELGFEHVGRHVSVQSLGEDGEESSSGILFDVVHRPGRASWLSFRVEGTPVVVVVEDPTHTTVLVGTSPDRSSASPREDATVCNACSSAR